MNRIIFSFATDDSILELHERKDEQGANMLVLDFPMLPNSFSHSVPGCTEFLSITRRYCTLFYHRTFVNSVSSASDFLLKLTTMYLLNPTYPSASNIKTTSWGKFPPPFLLYDFIATQAPFLIYITIVISLCDLTKVCLLYLSLTLAVESPQLYKRYPLYRVKPVISIYIWILMNIHSWKNKLTILFAHNWVKTFNNTSYMWFWGLGKFMLIIEYQQCWHIVHTQ